MNVFTKIYLAAVFLLLALAGARAQGTVTGSVTDAESGETIIGALVKIQGQEGGVLTDESGQYSITVPAGQVTLVAGFVGYEDKNGSVGVANGATVVLNFQMGTAANIMDEVVVVGYGVARKRELVGSVAKVDEVNDIAGGSFQNALQGKAPGVVVTQTSGVAGAGAVVRIRGNNSLSSAGDPLYVVDGIPIMNNNFQLGEAGAQNVNPLNSINPNDIESVEILKDAAAAAIYGSRGANGVIIITTKRGKTGRPRFTYNVRFGLSQETNRIDLLDADQWLAVRQEAWENDGNAGRAPLPGGLTYEDIEGINTNWMDQVLQIGFKHEHNLSMRAGNKWINAYVGASFSDAESYLRNNTFQRASGRVNLDITPFRNLKISINTSLSRGNTHRVPVAWSGGLGLAQSTALPIFPVTYDPLIQNALDRGDQARADYWSNLASQTDNWYNIYGNPLAQVDLTKQRVVEWRSINNAQIMYNPLPGLTLTGQGSLEIQKLGEFTFRDNVWEQNQGNYTEGYYQSAQNWSAFGTAEYDFSQHLGPDHKLRVMVGGEYQKTNYYRDLRVGYRGADDLLFNGPALDTPAVSQIFVDSFLGTSSNAGREKFLSAFGRINYTFRDKYMAQFTVRRDGSSRFGANNRFGWFPAVGAGWVVSEEAFLKNNPVVNFLKLKASVGLRGVAGIPTSEQWAEYSVVQSINGYNDTTERYQTKLANPNLKWETNRTIDCGFEIGLWNDRITADVTYYNSVTLDAIIKTRIQASTGIDYRDFYQNIGTIRNTGVEIGLVTRNLVGPLKWTTRLNMAHNSNVVVAVGAATPDALDGGFGDIRAIPGQPSGTNFIVRWAGVDPLTGRPIYLTAAGDSTSVYDVSVNRVAAGNVFPKLTGAITNEFTWKRFDLSFMLYFSLGSYIYDDAAKRQLGVVSDWNMRTEVLDRWRQPGDVASYPQLTMTMLNWGGNDNIWQNNHSLWLERADFLRLRNLTFGYNIPVKKGISNARIFFTGTNLLTFTNYSGWDPEVARGRENEQQRNIGGTNVTYLTPPQERAFIFGLDVDF